jgi:hypothetical protein
MIFILDIVQCLGVFYNKFFKVYLFHHVPKYHFDVGQPVLYEYFINCIFIQILYMLAKLDFKYAKVMLEWHKIEFLAVLS